MYELNNEIAEVRKLASEVDNELSNLREARRLSRREARELAEKIAGAYDSIREAERLVAEAELLGMMAGYNLAEAFVDAARLALREARLR